MTWGRRRQPGVKPLIDELNSALVDLQVARAQLCAVTEKVRSVAKDLVKEAEKDAGRGA